MPSPRRVRLFIMMAFCMLVVMLITTNHYRQIQKQDTRTLGDFYQKTKNAMDKGRHVGGGSGRQKPIAKDKASEHGGEDEEDEAVGRALASRLKLAEQKAKDRANAKAPNKPDAPEAVVGVGSSASGQGKKGTEVQKGKGAGDEDPEVESEINMILKKSPVVIFSKSYCPYSRKAKHILLDQYLIQPTPYVVELDLHPLGKRIQDRLAVMTGRKTVPNVMVYGISIGGGDDIAALDTEKKLGEKIMEIGGKRVDVRERDVKLAG
ncbi:thioredoxin-like protein [Podospora conica]|nr:thioredoxin-like protein [Schizothecium conicum]